ncbi:hypothetical protein CE91St39_29340 [Desulfovibrionaceae bacterium]|nr:hypothetical protein CE91St39_29340 [Desulfovibrionaceae bacterium]
MANRKLPEGAFRAKNGVWCVKKKCERCGREFNAGLMLDPKYCKGCRQVLRERVTAQAKKGRQREFRPTKHVQETRANNEYGFDEKAVLKQGVRRCHDCGKPSHGNYRCSACWSRIRGGSETAQRVDEDFVYA